MFGEMRFCLYEFKVYFSVLQIAFQIGAHTMKKYAWSFQAYSFS